MTKVYQCTNCYGTFVEGELLLGQFCPFCTATCALLDVTSTANLCLSSEERDRIALPLVDNAILEARAALHRIRLAEQAEGELL